VNPPNRAVQRTRPVAAASTSGMPPPWVYRGWDGALMIYSGVTRATRVARLAPGTTITVEVVREAKVPPGHLPKIGDLIP
jgi:hypothetical protein